MAKPPKSGRKVIGHFTFKPKGASALKLQPGSQAIAWDSIRPRPDVDTRGLDTRHLLSLARSIAAVGLIQPLAIDTSGKLIAGGHRLAVWALLAIEDPNERKAAFLAGLKDYKPSPQKAEEGAKLPEAEAIAQEIADLDLSAWKDAHADGLVPVLVFDEDAARLKNKSLFREVAENEKRRSYTAEEVEALAERLKTAGYEDIAGRPKEAQEPLRKELARILGRSSRQIRKILNDPKVTKAKRRNRDRLSNDKKIINTLSEVLASAEKVFAKDKDAKEIMKAASALGKLVEAYQAEQE